MKARSSRFLPWFSRLAILGGIAGCAEPPGASPGAPVPEPAAGADEGQPVQQTVRLPDGRIATLTGVRRGDDFVSGDMLFPLPQSGPRSATVQSTQLWPSTTIFYIVAGGVDPATRAKVLAGMAPWTAAGFTFVEDPNGVTGREISIMPFASPPWVCGATVGYRALSGHYDAGPSCTAHDYAHEWGHVLGLYHEHERTDRGAYILVDPSIDSSLANTIADRGGINTGPYDFSSIMHYDAYGRHADGSIDRSQIRILPLDNRLLDSFGFDSQPSAEDLAALRALYASRTPVPLYQLYSSQYQDWFYTIDPSQRAIAMQQYGYLDQGVAARVQPGPIGGALPFRRLYKGPPQTDHFYTTSLDEFSSARLLGWEDEQAEGYLYTTQGDCPDCRPLFRFSHWEAATSNLMHYYTVSEAIRSLLEPQGWTFEGTAGFVHAP